MSSRSSVHAEPVRKSGSSSQPGVDGSVLEEWPSSISACNGNYSGTTISGSGFLHCSGKDTNDNSGLGDSVDVRVEGGVGSHHNSAKSSNRDIASEVDYLLSCVGNEHTTTGGSEGVGCLVEGGEQVGERGDNASSGEVGVGVFGSQFRNQEIGEVDVETDWVSVYVIVVEGRGRVVRADSEGSTGKDGGEGSSRGGGGGVVNLGADRCVVGVAVGGVPGGSSRTRGLPSV